MKNILYIGNNLKSKRSNITGIQTLGALLEKEGYTMFYASSKNNKFLRLLDMLNSCVLLSRKINFVLIDTYSTQNFYFALVISQICRLLNINYIPILHGGNLPLRLRNNPKLCALIFKNATRNVSPSMYLKREFESCGYKNIVHIPNAIEICEYSILSKNYDSPKLLWVRSFSKIYNPMLAIKVFYDLKKSFPDATLCMVGPDSDGTLKEAKHLASELNLDVEFTGKLSRKEWVKVSEKYNVFINTTNYDNTPVSVIEAMALGLPIVSTNVGGLPFLISDNVDGLLVESNNVDAMLHAIIILISDQDLRDEMVRKARSKVENFAWNRVKLKWESLLS